MMKQNTKAAQWKVRKLWVAALATTCKWFSLAQVQRSYPLVFWTLIYKSIRSSVNYEPKHRYGKDMKWLEREGEIYTRKGWGRTVKTTQNFVDIAQD